MIYIDTLQRFMQGALIVCGIWNLWQAKGNEYDRLAWGALLILLSRS